METLIILCLCWAYVIMAAVHLVNCYCVATLTIMPVRFRICHLVISILLMFSGIMRVGIYLIAVGERESTSELQMYCGCLSMKYVIEQQIVLFCRRILRGSNVILRILLHQKVGYVQSLLSKFNTHSLLRPKHELKLHI